MATYKDLDKSYSEIEKFCLGKFQANEDLFKTTIKENIENSNGIYDSQEKDLNKIVILG